jgi:DNA-binding transcriptional LysR family regulator
VSEPAVSAAVAALRRDLGDELFVRAGPGIRLTPGGERLAATAAEILGLADRVRREVREARGERSLLRLAVAPGVAEYVSAPLLDAFTRAAPTLEVTQEVAAPEDFAALLADRRADIALGAAPPAAGGVDSTPFLRYKLIVVAAPGHRLSGVGTVPLARLAGERWLVGPPGIGPRPPVRRVRRRSAAMRRVRDRGGRAGRRRRQDRRDARDRPHGARRPPAGDARATRRTRHARATGCGTPRRSGPTGAHRWLTPSGASSRRPTPPRRSSPGRAACLRAASARPCT